MTASAASRESTSVSIDGTRTVLAFGARYRVRYGRDSKILEDALLVERTANGDLVFDAGTGTLVLKVRVRPSAIDAIFDSSAGLGDEVVESYDPATDNGPLIPDRFPLETLSSYLARLESELGSHYGRWIESETGQATLAAVAKEDRAARSGAKKEIERLRIVHPEIVDAVEATVAIAAPLAGPERVLDEIRSALGPICDGCEKPVDEVRRPYVVVDEGGSIPKRTLCLDCIALLPDDQRALAVDDAVPGVGHHCTEYGAVSTLLPGLPPTVVCTVCGSVLQDVPVQPAPKPKRAGIAGGRTPAIGPKPIGEIFPPMTTEKLKPDAQGFASTAFERGEVVVDPPTIPKAEARKILADAVVPKTAPNREEAVERIAKGRPYAERNQVWKCGTCKRRTRQPVCTGPAGATHDPVSAPAGKRRDDR